MKKTTGVWESGGGAPPEKEEIKMWGTDITFPNQRLLVRS